MSIAALPDELWTAVIHGQGFLVDGDVFVLAKTSSHFHRLFGHIVCSRPAVQYFIENGWEDLVRWDQEGPAPSNLTASAFLAAANANSLKIAKYLLEKRCPLSPHAAAIVARKGNVDFLSWLLDTSALPLEWGLTVAAASNSLAMLELVVKRGSPVNSMCLDNIIKSGNIEAVKWLRAHANVPFSPYFVANIAETGDLDLVKWAIENGAPNRESRLYLAGAAKNNVKVMQFAKDSGVPFTNSINSDCVISACVGFVEVLEWIRQNGGALFDPNTSLSWIYAAANEDPSVLKFGLAHGLQLSPVMFETAVKLKRYKAVAYLEELKCPINAQGIAAAISVNDFELAKRLKVSGIELSPSVTAAAAGSGDLSILKWALSSGTSR